MSHEGLIWQSLCLYFSVIGIVRLKLTRPISKRGFFPKSSTTNFGCIHDLQKKTARYTQISDF